MPRRCAGGVAAACTQGKRTQHGKPRCVVSDEQPDAREGQAGRANVGTVTKAYRVIDNYTAVRLRRWLRIKHKVRRRKGGTYPLSHLYGHFGLVRLSRLGHDVPWTKAGALVREPDAGN